MEFGNEPFVRIYTTVSPTARLWGFFGRCLMDQLVKVADRAGVIDLPAELADDLDAAVASVIHCPDTSWIREYLPKLMEHGSVVHREVEGSHYLVVPRYHEAQYCKSSVAQSKRNYEAKKRAIERATALGLIESPADEPQQAVG